MRAFALLLAVAITALTAACPGPSNSCALSATPPGDGDVADGRGTATRSDGESFDEDGSWSATSISVTIGTLDMIATQDEVGSDVAELIESGAFPICVLMGERSETSGSANLVDGGFFSDATHTGGLLLLGREGTTLLGRFAFELVNGSGTTLSFTDGAFRVPQR